MRTVAAAALLLSLVACSSFSEHSDTPGFGETLQGNLKVASAALAAGQPDVAQRLYGSLTELYDDAPEPLLGLGYIALQANDLDAAIDHFVRAAELAKDAPAAKAEALVGAGRAELAKGRTREARNYLHRARKIATDPSSAAWIENGLAVAAVLDGDYGTAETHYAAALRHSSAHPRITANYMRMLIASGRIDEAVRVYGEFDSSYWMDGDERALQRLIDEARGQGPERSSSRRLEPRLLLRWPAIVPLPPPRSESARRAARFALAGSLGLAFRLDGEAGMVIPPADAPHSFSVRADVRSPDAASWKPSSRSASSSAPGAPQSVTATGMPAAATDYDSAPDSDPAPPAHLERLLGSEGAAAYVRQSRVLDGWVVLLGRSRQWRLDGAAEAVAAASPEIADVQLLAPDVLYVIGKTVGSTSVSVLSENGLVQKRDVTVVLDVEPLRALLAEYPDLNGVRVQGLARGVTLTGEVGSAAAAARALRLAAASLPEDMVVENGLRVGLNLAPLRALMVRESGLHRVHVQRVTRGVALTGEVGSAAAAARALRLAAASLPEDMVVENGLRVGLDLAPLRALMVEGSGLHGVRVQRVARGVALTGEVGSAAAAERAHRLAVASLPEDMVVENGLRVVMDVEPLRVLLANDSDLNDVKVQALSRGVALSGEVNSAAAADLALRFAAASLPEETVLENNMHIAGPQQVNLEVQIAEVQRSIAEDFGFNWQAFGNSADPLGFGFQIGRALPLPGRMLPEVMLPQGMRPPDGDWSLFPINPPKGIPSAIVDGLTSPSFIFQRAWHNIGITGVVDALAQAGLANVLARPNVTANSGETASFFSGGEYPLPSGYDDGVIVFEYKKFGVLLDFVPTIIDEDRIELTVRPEVSEPSRDQSIQVHAGVNVPVINVRRAETTVEMGDGESIVIAGLFRSTTSEVESGVPFLKDLPLIGALFGHTSTRSEELELIVTVTARLIDAGQVLDETGSAAAGRADDYYY